jgi:hypothetical protein
MGSFFFKISFLHMNKINTIQIVQLQSAFLIPKPNLKKMIFPNKKMCYFIKFNKRYY